MGILDLRSLNLCLYYFFHERIIAIRVSFSYSVRDLKKGTLDKGLYLRTSLIYMK